jgi:hypothetical protein
MVYKFVSERHEPFVCRHGRGASGVLRGSTAERDRDRGRPNSPERAIRAIVGFPHERIRNRGSSQ